MNSPGNDSTRHRSIITVCTFAIIDIRLCPTTGLIRLLQRFRVISGASESITTVHSTYSTYRFFQKISQTIDLIRLKSFFTLSAGRLPLSNGA